MKTIEPQSVEERVRRAIERVDFERDRSDRMLSFVFVAAFVFGCAVLLGYLLFY